MDFIEVQSGTSLQEALFNCGIPPDLVAIAFSVYVPKNKDEIVLPGEIIDLVAVIGGG